MRPIGFAFLVIAVGGSAAANVADELDRLDARFNAYETAFEQLETGPGACFPEGYDSRPSPKACAEEVKVIADLFKETTALTKAFAEVAKKAKGDKSNRSVTRKIKARIEKLKSDLTVLQSALARRFVVMSLAQRRQGKIEKAEEICSKATKMADRSGDRDVVRAVERCASPDG